MCEHAAQLPPPLLHPTLSVVVPMYQSGPTIAATIRSILNDPVDGGLEIIVVNDGSGDDGPLIAAEFAHADPQVRLIHRANGGLAAARNTGIEHARGQWVRFLDADDLAIPGSSARLIAHAISHDLSGACASHELIDEQGSSLDRVCPALAGPDGTIGIDQFLDSNRCGVGTVVIRAGALATTRFDESLRVCEDWDLWLRLCAAGLRIGVRPGEPVTRYRVRRASLSKDFGAMLDTGQGILQRAHARLRKSPITGVDAPDTREAHAMHRLALEWATMRALSDRPGRLEDAESMFTRGRGQPFDADQAAHTALWGALLGLGTRPDAHDHNAAEWLARTASWWDRCVDLGRLGVPEIERAWRILAELVVPPIAVARTCIDDVLQRERKGVIIIGAGEGGRVLAQTSHDAGLPTIFRDDRLDSGRLDPATLPAHTRTQPMSAPIEAGWGVVISILNDAAVARRPIFAGAARLIETRRRLAGVQEQWIARTLQDARNRRVGVAAGR